MKKIISKTAALLAIVATMLSFTAASPTGGEGFEIYVNGKVILQRFNKEVEVVKTLRLNAASPNDKISFRYYHCGMVGKNRFLTIKNSNGAALKVWRYTDHATPVNDMDCTVKDLLSVQKASAGALKIFYSSSQLPQGRQLADVVFADAVKK